LKLLSTTDREFRVRLDLHLILDKYGTPKHHAVKAWLKKHRRFQLHFTPTSPSWLNLVERWFRELTTKLRRGTPKANALTDLPAMLRCEQHGHIS